mmetsp:Transcript_33160/g.90780  ORF Transcript_33160/g.90780 Transcript_33160/m.90780 type:complete len:224 (-) Transcript_33160:591-1262(-)
MSTDLLHPRDPPHPPQWATTPRCRAALPDRMQIARRARPIAPEPRGTERAPTGWLRVHPRGCNGPRRRAHRPRSGRLPRASGLAHGARPCACRVAGVLTRGGAAAGGALRRIDAPRPVLLEGRLAVRVLHLLVRLEQPLEVNVLGRAARARLGYPPLAHLLQLQPEKANLRHRRQPVLECVEGRRLRQQHQDAAEGLDERRVALGLEQLQPHVRKDGRLEQLD